MYGEATTQTYGVTVLVFNNNTLPAGTYFDTYALHRPWPEVAPRPYYRSRSRFVESRRWHCVGNSHSYPPALREDSVLDRPEPRVVSLRPSRPWMARLHGGPHERTSRRRKRRTWEATL